MRHAWGMNNLSTEAERLALLNGLLASGEARRIRETAGLPGSVAARSAGIDQSTLWRWESGERRPTGEPARRYLDLLLRLQKAQP